MRKNLVLLGMMGVGKTTLGKILAKNYKLGFVDIDSKIEEKTMMSINEIFEKKGEKFFRNEEEKEVLKLIKKRDCVLAFGGGTFINDLIRNNVLKNSISVWIDVDLKTLNKRIKWNRKRPLLDSKNNQKIISQLYTKRKSIYKLANYRIDCSNLDKKSIADKIIVFYEKK